MYTWQQIGIRVDIAVFFGQTGFLLHHFHLGSFVVFLARVDRLLQRWCSISSLHLLFPIVDLHKYDNTLFGPLITFESSIKIPPKTLNLWGFLDKRHTSKLTTAETKPSIGTSRSYRCWKHSGQTELKEPSMPSQKPVVVALRANDARVFFFSLIHKVIFKWMIFLKAT
ncbi:unnamed protein product [Cochlearia groenlandica]